jgi:sensor histidine kinase YesM
LLLEVRNRIGSVENSGLTAARGIGLSNTRARLEQLYSSQHSFEIANREGGGVAVKLSLPTSGDVTYHLSSKAGRA